MPQGSQFERGGLVAELRFEVKLWPEGAEVFLGSPVGFGVPFVWEDVALFDRGGFPEAVTWLRWRLVVPSTGTVFVFGSEWVGVPNEAGTTTWFPTAPLLNRYRVQLRPVVRS